MEERIRRELNSQCVSQTHPICAGIFEPVNSVDTFNNCRVVTAGFWGDREWGSEGFAGAWKVRSLPLPSPRIKTRPRRFGRVSEAVDMRIDK
jgi:hypothetical protein